MRFKILHLLFFFNFISCNGQKPFGTEHLKLERVIVRHCSKKMPCLLTKNKARNKN